MHRSIGRYRRLRERKLLTALEFHVTCGMFFSSCERRIVCGTVVKNQGQGHWFQSGVSVAIGRRVDSGR